MCKIHLGRETGAMQYSNIQGGPSESIRVENNTQLLAQLDTQHGSRV
jgi:hypothetical protein